MVFDPSSRCYGYLPLIIVGTLVFGIILGLGIGLGKSHISTLAGNVSRPPAYIDKVLDVPAGDDGTIIIIRFNDANDKPTVADGQVTVELYDKYRGDADHDYAWIPFGIPFVTKTFHISQKDFKDTDYGSWDALMVTLPRIKYPNGFNPQSSYGVAIVMFAGSDGKELSGTDNAVELTH